MVALVDWVIVNSILRIHAKVFVKQQLRPWLQLTDAQFGYERTELNEIWMKKIFIESMDPKLLIFGRKILLQINPSNTPDSIVQATCFQLAQWISFAEPIFCTRILRNGIRWDAWTCIWSSSERHAASKCHSCENCRLVRWMRGHFVYFHGYTYVE